MAEKEITLSSPDISEHEIKAVTEVMRSSRLSLGPKVAEFEKCFTDRFRVKHAVACSSGTSGLHLLWVALGVGRGDEVITTPFSFIASSNSVMFVDARPVFCDIDPRTWQIDATRIEAHITPKTRAILPVDVFGSFPDMDAISALARRHNLRVLEDSCEALASLYQGRPAGTLADAGVFGFYPNKQITTGEGGMIVTNDDRLAGLCRSLRNQGRDPDAGWLAHARLGYNYRLPDINCAVGIEQMRRLDVIIGKRTRVAEWYTQRLRDVPGVSMQHVPADQKVNWFVMVVKLDDSYAQEHRDQLMRELGAKGIQTNNYFTPIHLQPFYREKFGYAPGDMPHTERLAARTLALPFHNRLSEADVDRVVRTLKSLL